MLLTLIAVVLSGCSGSKTRLRSAGDESSIRKSPRAAFISPQTDPGWVDSRAFNYYANAVIFELAGYIPEAAEGYRLALQYHPDSYEIRFSFARMLMYLKRYADIPEALDPIDPKDGDVYDMLATAYRYLGEEDSARWAYAQVALQDSLNRKAYSHLAASYQREGDIDSLIWAYENLARIQPYDFSLHYELGKLHSRRGNVEAALEHYNKSIELEPSEANILAYVRLSDLYQAMEKYDDAASTLKLALKVAPDDVVINRYLANYYLERDSLSQSLTYARKLTELTPDDNAARYRLALVYYGLDSLDQARTIFENLVETGEVMPSNHFYLGRIAILQEDYLAARDQFVTLTQLVDTLAQGWLDLAYVYTQLGQPEQAIGAYQTGLGRVHDPEERTRLLFALGASYEQAGQIDSSVTAFEKLLAVTPDHAGAMNYLGYMLCDRGERLDYARELIEKAVSMDPDNAAYLDSYGWVFYRMGKYDRALSHLKRAAELDNDPVILDHLGDTYKALNDLEQARKWWLKALQEDPDNEEIKKKLGQ